MFGGSGEHREHQPRSTFLLVGDDATSNPSNIDVAINVTNGTLVESRDVGGVAHPVPAASTKVSKAASVLTRINNLKKKRPVGLTKPLSKIV